MPILKKTKIFFYFCSLFLEIISQKSPKIKIGVNIVSFDDLCSFYYTPKKHRKRSWLSMFLDIKYSFLTVNNSPNAVIQSTLILLYNCLVRKRAVGEDERVLSEKMKG